MPSIALTGHRPARLDGYDLSSTFYRRLQDELLRISLRSLHSSKDVLTLHSGMALGADTLWAEAIILLRQAHPGRVGFVAHVPFPGQPDRWPSRAQQHYRSLLAQADEIRTHGTGYSPEAMQLRNIGMIDAAKALIAVYDGSGKGGTANAVSYARSAGKPIITLHPDRFREGQSGHL